MRMSTKVVIGFAVAGFVLPLLLLVFHAKGTLGFYLCPPLIVAMAFAIDGPGWLPNEVVTWFIICLSNALLYAVPAFAIVLGYRVIRPDPQADGSRLR